MTDNKKSFFKKHFNHIFFSVMFGFCLVLFLQDKGKPLTEAELKIKNTHKAILKTTELAKELGFIFDEEPIAKLIKVGVFSLEKQYDHISIANSYYTLWCIDSLTYRSIVTSYSKRIITPSTKNMSLVVPQVKC